MHLTPQLEGLDDLPHFVGPVGEEVFLLALGCEHVQLLVLYGDPAGGEARRKAFKTTTTTPLGGGGSTANKLMTVCLCV